MIATSRNSASRAKLIELGADAVVTTAEESLSERVTEITGGKGADIVYDCVWGGR